MKLQRYYAKHKELIVGEATDIKAIAGSLWRADRKREDMKIYPLFDAKPRFHMGKCYGILIEEENAIYKNWYILDASGVLRELEMT